MQFSIPSCKPTRRIQRHTDKAFLRDIFLQLKHDSLPSKFCLEFSRQETLWMMNKEQVTSRSLMDDAAAYYVNLKNTGSWKTEMSATVNLLH